MKYKPDCPLSLATCFMFVLKVHSEQADGGLTCRQVSGVHGDLDPRPQRELDQVLIQGVQQEVRELATENT